MRILINCSNLKIGGGLQVAHSFINEIKFNQKHEFLIVLSESLKELITTSDFPANFHFVEYTINATVLKALSCTDIFLSKLEKEFDTERVFTIFGPSYWKPKAMHICGFAKAQYIYS